jgi:hypothetical protein
MPKDLEDIVEKEPSKKKDTKKSYTHTKPTLNYGIKTILSEDYR